MSLPTRGGTVLLLEAGRLLQDRAIPLDDLGIRRPSLDDVFLALTGSMERDTDRIHTATEIHTAAEAAVP